MPRWRGADACREKLANCFDLLDIRDATELLGRHKQSDVLQHLDRLSRPDDPDGLSVTRPEKRRASYSKDVGRVHLQSRCLGALLKQHVGPSRCGIARDEKTVR